LHVAVHASRTLACALVAAHLAAAGAVIVAVPQWSARVAACVVIFANACWSLRRHAWLLAPRAVVELEFRGESECALRQRDGRRVTCYVRGSSHVSTGLVVLHLETPGRRLARYVVLAPDSIASDRFRRLRVRLRWASPHQAGIAARNAPL
jgi:hypothetical protein